MPASVDGQPDAVGRRSTRDMDDCVSTTNRADPAPSVDSTREREIGGVELGVAKWERKQNEPGATPEVRSARVSPRHQEALRALVRALATNAARADHAVQPTKDRDQWTK